MLSKTHLAWGITASLLVLQPRTPKDLAAAVIGGALGGSIPDIDNMKSRTNIDSIITQGTALLIAGGAVVLDWQYHLGILRYLMNHPESAVTGAVFYLIFAIAGFYSPHRGFTHSILAMALFTAAAGMIYPGAAEAYMLGYVSHLVLDLLNRKPLKLFFPLKKGICLKLCYSNRLANKLFFWSGCILSVILLLCGIVNFLPLV